MTKINGIFWVNIGEIINKVSCCNTKHSFHLVDASPWPFTSSLGGLILASGFVLWLHKIFYGKYILRTGICVILMVMILWWRDVIRESLFENSHNKTVQKGVRLSIILFIVSEIMFFFAFFWSFFHSSMSPTFNLGGVWPPKAITSITSYSLPLTNTFLLLTSGCSLTWSHNSLVLQAKNHTVLSLIITIILAFFFTKLQTVEYISSPFCISDSVYGSCFYLATGFHGFHVLIGTIALIISAFRILFSHFTTTQHIGFESSIWYWHFVDVVWLFLFASVYWWSA